MAAPKDGLKAKEIEITPEMLEAGVRAYREWDSRFGEAEDLILSVWEAMMKNRESGPHEDHHLISAVQSE